MRGICLVVAAILAGLGPTRAEAQATAGPTLAPKKAAAVDAAVLEVMDKQELVGVAIGVIEDGRIVYTKGYGWADREHRIPATAETVINWASNSKPMAAILALQLAEQGQLDLDADVRTYVPEFPDKGVTITCRQILGHQSGIPHYSNGQIVPTRRDAESRRGPVDPLRSLDRFAESPLIFRPGARSEYSSYAYILLSAVVERAGKQPFDDQVQGRIAAPLGIRSLQLDHHTPGRDWATGYTMKEGKVVPAPEEANDWKFGAGGYKSNVQDFARWAAALLDHRLVSKTTERSMWTQQRTAGGETTDYGLGFAVEDGARGFKVSHNGDQREATTRMVLYPKARQGMVVMTNCGHGKPGEISTAVFAALSRKR